MKFNDGDRVIHEHYGEGSLLDTGNTNTIQRCSGTSALTTPGIDDDILEESKLEQVNPPEAVGDHSKCRDCPRCCHPECLHETGPCIERNGCDCPEFVRATKVLIFPNGNVFVSDKDGEQMPEIQGSWIDFDYVRKLAETIAKDSPEVSGMETLPSQVMDSFRAYYQNTKEEERE